MTGRTALQPYSRLTHRVRYPVSAAALEYWAKKDLACMIENGGVLHFTYPFKGSTCTNGGTEFTVAFHVLLEKAGGSLAVGSGWIGYTESEEHHLRRMCAWPETEGPNSGMLRIPPIFIGKPIEKALTRKLPVNPAGCLCTAAARNIKWLWALCTMHYAVKEGMEIRSGKEEER